MHLTLYSSSKNVGNDRQVTAIEPGAEADRKMGKAHFVLTKKRVDRLTEPGRYHDGFGLYLQVHSSTNRSWIFRYEVEGRERWMGLGALHAFNLDEAREPPGRPGSNSPTASIQLRPACETATHSGRKRPSGSSLKTLPKSFSRFMKHFGETQSTANSGA